MIKYEKLGIPICALLLAASSSTGFAATQQVPDWSYDALIHLAEAGYVTLPGDVHSLSREDLAALTAQALKAMDDRMSPLAQEYGRVTRWAAMDQVQMKLYQEKEKQVDREYQEAFASLQSAALKLAHHAQQGDNVVDRMQKLQKEEQANSVRLENAGRDKAIVQTQIKRYKLRLDGWEAKKVQILQQMSSNTENAEQGMSGDGNLSSSDDVQLNNEAAQLRTEFANELSHMGYFDDENSQNQAQVQLPPQVIPDKRFHLDGELRLDSGHHTGEEGIGDRTRLRLRLFPDYNIDGNWHAIGMVESEKTLNGEGSDGNLKLDRYYLEGHVGPTLLDVGAFGTLMAEGNIYDSKFTGIRAQVGNPVKYTFEAGKVDRAHNVFTAAASYNTATYGLGAGYYHFSRINDAMRNIYMVNFRKPIGFFDFGAMYLRGVDAVAGNGNGYVLTLSHGKNDSWSPGASSYYLKYYRQPSSTYVEHTMNGMADYMSFDHVRPRGGFRGFGLGATYTLKKDWVAALEYDNLWDLTTHAHSNTIWGALTYYFKNYED